MRSRSALALGAAGLLAAAVAAAGADPAFRLAAPGYAWSFPRDHSTHPGYRNEWWYFTGQLAAEGEPARRFGYQLTLFRVGLVPERPPFDSAWSAANLAMGHAALSELSAGRHRFSEVLARETPFLGGFPPFPDPLLAWVRAPSGTEGRWTVRREGDGFALAMEDRAQGFALRLSARPRKPVVLQGPGGLSVKSAAPGHASLYYSLTRLETSGELEVDGRRYRVAGESWMDKEVGSSQLGPGQVGWDWFSLQLADGRDLMLYALRRADGSVDFASATLVDAAGRPRWLAPGEWSARSDGRWRSPATGADYPAGWRVEVPGEGIRLTVTPLLADQENRARAGGLFYWEGAVSLSGDGGRPAGQGYVELTGYGRENRPPL
ncbi:lipocalin-like domain-containing protein [Anaeromyxobacter paludicola]|uniref:Carotenoid 1,2-hydratase n=1 Tax=Anaeromyxobacter paludicola TaxID=2918171 RepID=A0ABN6N2C9_9BACT|nr:lipocalin-like domain-containing protein [Anaeromyxobacter paludicola]BDG07354.1 carotenoid 1,2-hydratase [Anaeromyxobacter paludicola]